MSEAPPPPGSPGHDPLSDRMVTPERSVFGTRLPRPTGVGRHLLVVILLSLVALAIAVVFAERDSGEEEQQTVPRRFGVQADKKG